MQLFHGTRNEFADADISPKIHLFGIYCTTEEEVAKIYGTVKRYRLTTSAKVLNISEGDILWEFMKEHEILSPEDQEDIDLENYIIGGRLFQYDISSNTRYADYVARTAKSLGYDVVMTPDDLGGRGNDIAYVVVNPKVLTPEG